MRDKASRQWQVTIVDNHGNLSRPITVTAANARTACEKGRYYFSNAAPKGTFAVSVDAVEEER